MQDELRELVRALRKAAPAAAWRVGERAAANGNVSLVSQDSDSSEYVLRVKLGNGPPNEIYLWPDEVEWECDCESPAQACAHAVAAIRGLSGGLSSLPEAAPPAHIVLLLRRRQGSLELELGVRRQQQVEAWSAQGSPGLRPSEEFARLNRLQGEVAGGRIAPRNYSALLSALLSAEEVQLDGEVISISKVPIHKVAVIAAVGSNFRLTLEPPETVTELFEGEPTLALTDHTLRPLGNGKLSKLQLHQLRRPLLFHNHELPRLTGEWIPALERCVDVIRRGSVPESQAAEVTVRLELQRRAGLLEAEARIVYGDPPLAELRDNNWIPLGGLQRMPARNRDAELQAVNQLQAQLGMRPGQRLRLLPEDAARFVRDRLPQFSGQLIGEHQARSFRVDRTPLRPELQWQGNGLQARFMGEAGEADPVRVLEAWRQGQELVSLGSQGMAALPIEWLDQHGHLLALSLEADEQVAARLAPLAEELLGQGSNQLPEGLRQLNRHLRELGTLPLLDPPAGLEARLRDYQLLGFSWLRLLAQHKIGAILADDMGLGKTLQTLAALLPDRDQGPALVVAPTSVLRNWELEAARFTPALRSGVLHGPRRERLLQQLQDGDLDLLITSYAIVRRDIDRLAEHSFRAVVIDEAQAIKNPDSQTRKAIARLKADQRIALSGTPIENRLLELWSIMDWVNPGLLGPRQHFAEQLAGPAGRGNTAAATAISRQVRPFLLRRLKAEVAAELPPRTESVLHCPLSEAQQRSYAAVRQAAISGLRGSKADNKRGRRMQVLAALTRMRQAACHPGLLPGGDPSAQSGKLDRLMELLPSLIEAGHKALLFSQWTAMLDLVENRLKQERLRFVRLDGSTRDRAGPIERFQAADGPPLFLISLKAGGTGLNLTAADHVFHLDPWWNPAVEQQATDRAHRIGQTRPVFSWKLISENSVEERILALQERKKALVESVLGGKGIEALSIEELESLLDDAPL